MVTLNDRLDSLFTKLSHSRFRSRFHLTGKDLEYFKSKDMDTILQHGMDFLNTRLAPANPKNDTKQTPFKGHRIFIAQHATATCCRECLEKWHGLERGKELREGEKMGILAVWRRW